MRGALRITTNADSAAPVSVCGRAMLHGFEHAGAGVNRNPCGAAKGEAEGTAWRWLEGRTACFEGARQSARRVCRNKDCVNKCMQIDSL